MSTSFPITPRDRPALACARGAKPDEHGQRRRQRDLHPTPRATVARQAWRRGRASRSGMGRSASFMRRYHLRRTLWMPAFAGMTKGTEVLYLILPPGAVWYGARRWRFETLFAAFVCQLTTVQGYSSANRCRIRNKTSFPRRRESRYVLRATWGCRPRHGTRRWRLRRLPICTPRTGRAVGLKTLVAEFICTPGTARRWRSRPFLASSSVRLPAAGRR